MNFAGILDRGGLDFILAGLKNNDQVIELNVQNNELDDEDLRRICERIEFD